MRAILLASATATRLKGFFSMSFFRPCAQRICMGFTMKQHGMRPTTSNLRKYRLPIFEYARAAGLPPEEFRLALDEKGGELSGPEKLGRVLKRSRYC